MKCLRTGILLLPFLALFIFSPALATEGDVITIDTKNSATETLESLKKLAWEKGYTIFSTYEHGDKETIKHVIAFGKVKHHARIMWHDSAAGLELPLKIAVFQDDKGGSQVIYRKPTSMRKTYGLEYCRLLDKLDRDMAELAQLATQ